MHFVFWHPFLSIHHAPLMRRLSAMPGINVTLMARLGMEDGRESSGWELPDYGNTRLIETTKSSNWRALVSDVIDQAPSESLHLASDALSHPICRRAWRQCAQRGIPFGFISIRPGMYVGRAGQLLRHALYRFYVRRAARNANPILTISQQCRQFFIDSGFSPECIFPWAYFVEGIAPPVLPAQNDELKLIYLGRLIKRKRVDLLLSSLQRVSHLNAKVRLTIIGSGPEENAYRSLTEKLGLNHRVEFKPVISNEHVHSELQKHDVLALPTECDDWGVVINEALQAGLAVITTKNAGACELIQFSETGLICKCDAQDIASAITRLLHSPHDLALMRERARSYSRTISPQAAACYLRDIADHVLHNTARPEAPWQHRISHGETA